MTRAGYGADEIYTRMALEFAARVARAFGALRPADLPPDRRALLRAADRRLFPRQSIEVHRRLGLPIEVLDGADAATALPEIDFNGIEAGLLRARLRRADGAPRGADPGRRIRRAPAANIGRRRCAPPADAPRCATRSSTATRRDHRRRTSSSSPAAPGSASCSPICSAGASSRPGRRCSSSRPRPATRSYRARPAARLGRFQRRRHLLRLPRSRGARLQDRPRRARSADRSGHAATGPGRRRRWPTCAPSWPAASRASPSRPLSEARVCQYENSSNGDFLIDRHPRWDNVVLVGGGSGHGFKHGPAVGRYAADLALGRLATPEPRFASPPRPRPRTAPSIDGKDHRRRRAVCSRTARNSEVARHCGQARELASSMPIR